MILKIGTCDYVSLVQSVEGMKVVCHELTTTDPESSAMDDLLKDADRLVACLATKVNVDSFVSLI